MRRRKICWPELDEVCMAGGCIHCEDGKWKTERQIRNYASKHGLMTEFNYSLRSSRWTDAGTKEA